MKQIRFDSNTWTTGVRDLGTHSRCGQRNEMKDLRERDAKDIRRLIEGRVLFNVPMKRFTSMKVGGPADGLFFPKDVDELRRVVRHARKKSHSHSDPGEGDQSDCDETRGFGDG